MAGDIPAARSTLAVISCTTSFVMHCTSGLWVRTRERAAATAFGEIASIDESVISSPKKVFGKSIYCVSHFTPKVG